MCWINVARLKLKASGSDSENELIVEITKVEILDGNGQSFDSVYTDEPLMVRLNYFAYKNIGRANALVRIYRSDGSPVASYARASMISPLN